MKTSTLGRQIIWATLLVTWLATAAHPADFFCADVTCLSAAMTESNKNAQDNRIFLQAEVFTLQSPLPVVTGRVDVFGLVSTVERDPNAEPFSIFHVAFKGRLRLVNIVVKGGDPAGIVNNLALLFLNSVTLTENAIGLDALGVFSSGGVNDIRFTTFSANQLAIRNGESAFSLFTVVLERNQRVLSMRGFSSGEMRNSTVRDNEGGMSFGDPARLVVSDSAYIRNKGSITTTDSLELRNSTVAFNETEDGAIHFPRCGAGSCAIIISNSTIAANRGRLAGGITIQPEFMRHGAIQIQNSIITGNTAEEGATPDCHAGGSAEAIRSLGNNIVGGCEFAQQSSDIFADPRLGFFREDEVPGQSHFPLLAGSPAIDAANPDVCPETDQLGNPRIGVCDIGAVEFDGTIDPELTASPGSVPPGGSLAATWSGIATPSSTDWLGLYTPGAANTAYIDWLYVSCSKTAAAARDSGSCNFALPSSISPGQYELRLLANDGFTALALSNAFTVTAGNGGETILTASPASVTSGGTVTATWSGIASPTPTDWIGLYQPGAPNSAYIEWIYVSCSQTAGSSRASGSCGLVVPSSVSPGQYELRLLSNDGFTAIAHSKPFTVGSGSGALSLTASAGSVAAGESITAAWNGIGTPSATDWVGLYTPGASNTAFLEWIFVSCSQTPAGARSSGTCSFPIPSSVAPGTYQLRLLANDGFESLASSNSFSVTAPTQALGR